MTKEVYTIEDFQGMYCVGYNKAAQMIRDIKRQLMISPKFKNEELRVNIRGKIHVLDYNDFIKGRANGNQENESL
jgi:hypothetical protein